MIYEVYLDGNLLYYPNDETYVILNSTLQLALNEAGSFEFDVPNYNLRYDDFKLRKSMIQVLQNGEEIFYGEVREVKNNSDFTKHVYAVGELAFLFDSIQPQGRYLTTPLNSFIELIAKHNSQVEDRKKFTVSQVSVSDRDNQIYFYTNGEDTLSVIRDKICDTLDGYIRITKDTSGRRYIGIVPLSYFGTCSQSIEFGENLLDYSCNMSASDIATCVTPRGAKIDDENRTADAVEGLDEYLTIKGTTADYYHKNKDYDYVQLDEAIANFGYVRVLKTWDNVTIAENLKAKAIEWLKSAQYENMTLELKAIDMSQFDVNIDTFKVGEQVHIWALPYGMDTNIPVRKKTIYLSDLEKNEVVLGNSTRESFTSQASKAVQALKEEIPEDFPVLRQAKDNAINMLTDPAKGYVTYVFDENGNRTEIWIADNLDNDKATKKWVWNSSGLGYLFKKPDGSWDTSVAITIDGKISANFITTGTMSANHIRGGILEVGGKDSGKDGSIEVKNEAGTTLITLNKNGMTLSGGQKIAWSNISDQPDIPDNFDDLDGTVASTQISDNAITTAKINASAITSEKINANAVTSDKISVDSLDAVSANMGTVNVGGNDNGYGTLYVKDKDGNVKVTLDSDGIKAEQGYIGSDSDGWHISSKYINSKDGPTTPLTTTVTNGTYVGTDGIYNSNGTYFARMTGGEISTNGAIGANSMSASDHIFTDGYVKAHDYYALEGEDTYQGADSNFTISGYNSDGQRKYIGVKFVDGLLVGVSFSDRD